LEELRKNDIKNYGAEQIQVLEGLEAVRKRPSMYIGNTSVEGLHHLVFEVVDNSVDEALMGYCDEIKVVIQKEGSVMVEDNGRGIPVGVHQKVGRSAVEVVLTKLHAGGKFDRYSYKISGGLHGVGVSVVNALSEWLEVEIHQNQRIWRQRYQRGKPINDLVEVGPTNHTGTVIRFLPDSEIFPDRNFHFDILAQRLKELAFLNEGLKICLKDERNDKEKEYCYHGGIKALVTYLNRGKNVVHNEPIYLKGEKDEIKVEVAFQYNDSYLENLISFTNNINTIEGGSHVNGFKLAINR